MTKPHSKGEVNTEETKHKAEPIIQEGEEAVEAEAITNTSPTNTLKMEDSEGEEAAEGVVETVVAMVVAMAVAMVVAMAVAIIEAIIEAITEEETTLKTNRNMGTTVQNLKILPTSFADFSIPDNAIEDRPARKNINLF